MLQTGVLEPDFCSGMKAELLLERSRSRASDPDSLQLEVVMDNGWMALPAPVPVVGMAGPPFPATILTAVPVFRIRGDLPAVIIGAPSPLAFRLAADGLLRLTRRWLEDPLTIATSPFDHTGVVALSLETVIECVARPRCRLFSQLQNRWDTYRHTERRSYQKWPGY